MFSVSKLAVLTSLPIWLSAQILSLRNGSFEEEFRHWSPGDSMCALISEGSHGNHAVRITDESEQLGSSLFSSAVAVQADSFYQISFWARNSQSSDSVALYGKFFDQEGALISQIPESYRLVPRTAGWEHFQLLVRAPAQAHALKVWIHSVVGKMGSTDFDDIRIARVSQQQGKDMIQQQLNDRGCFRLDPQRVRELERMLDDEPHGFGKPVQDRAFWEHLPNQRGVDKLLARAESYARTKPEPLPDDLYLQYLGTGNRTNYQDIYFRRRERLLTFGVAEAIEHKGRFLPSLMEEIEACLRDKSWTFPAHDSKLTNFHQTRYYPDLFAADRAHVLATFAYWFQNEFPNTLLQRMSGQIHARAIQPYLEAIHAGKTPYGLWWMLARNNWNTSCTNNLIGAILTLVQDKHTRALALAMMEISNACFLRGFQADGYCTEGVGYWNGGFGAFASMAEFVLQETRGTLDIMDHPQVKAVASFPFKIIIEPGVAPAFADCGVMPRMSANLLMMIQKHFPDLPFQAIDPGAPALTGMPTILPALLQDLQAYAPRLPARGSLPLRSSFPDSGVYVFRVQPEAGKVFGVAIKAGHNDEEHNHNDVGSYLLTWKGKGFVIDPGGEVYTRRTFSPQRYESDMLNSYGHPVPMPAHAKQSPGRTAEGRVVLTAFSETEDKLVMDLTKAYPQAQDLVSLTRTLVIKRSGPPAATFTDTFSFSTPQSASTALITTCTVVEEPERSAFLLVTQREAVRVTVCTQGIPWTLQQETIDNAGKAGPQRVAISLIPKVSRGTISYTVSPVTMTPELYRKTTEEPEMKVYAPEVEKAILLPAGAFSEQRGGTVVAEPKCGADQLAIKFWDNKNHRLSWRLEGAEPMTAALLLKVCCANQQGAKREILLDGKRVGTAHFPCTGGWSNQQDDWQEVWAAVRRRPLLLKLSPGRHTLTLVNVEGEALNLNWIKLVPVRIP